MPGGAGTLEEIFEVWTWAMLGSHDKPVGVVNTAGYYDGMIDFADKMVEQGFLKPKYRRLLLTASTPEAILDQFDLGSPIVTTGKV